jgi:hypothetical protein
MKGQFTWKAAILWHGKLVIFDDGNGDDSAKPGHCAWNCYSLAFKTVFATGKGNGDIMGQQAPYGKLYVCDCEKKKNKWEVVLTFHGRNS